MEIKLFRPLLIPDYRHAIMLLNRGRLARNSNGDNDQTIVSCLFRAWFKLPYVVMVSFSVFGGLCYDRSTHRGLSGIHKSYLNGALNSPFEIQFAFENF